MNVLHLSSTCFEKGISSPSLGTCVSPDTCESTQDFVLLQTVRRGRGPCRRVDQDPEERGQSTSMAEVGSRGRGEGGELPFLVTSSSVTFYIFTS